MLRFLLSLTGVLATTALGLFAIVLGIWLLGACVLCITWLARNIPDCEFFALGGLTCIVLCFAHKLGGAVWRLLN